jgi:5'-3' exonuclease
MGYPGAMPHLYLVDGSSFIFRAYHVLPKLTNKHGEPAGAVYGYVSMLWKLASELHKAEGPTHLAVILDKSEHTFRNELYDQYKAHRPPAPEDLKPQFPMIRDATRAFSLPCIEELGWEADDLIASYSKAALAQGWQVTIVSSDKDLMQLLTEPGIDMLDTMKDRRMGPEAVVEKFGVGPDKLGEVLALMGDSVDNVPGVPGVGPKTAAKLILEHGDVEAVLAAAPTMKPGKLRDNLIEHADMARLSRKLVALAEDVPLPEPLDDFVLDGIPDAPLRAFLEHHGFKTLLARLGSEASSVADAPVETQEVPGLEPDPPCDHDGYETVVDEAALDRWITVARHQGWVAIDTETTGTDATRAELVGVSLALHPNLACYIPVGHGGTDMFAEKPVQLDRATVLAKLKPLLEDPAVLKIGHNLKYDLIILGRLGIDVTPFDDTIVMETIIISRAVAQQQRRRPSLPCGMALVEKCIVGRRKALIDRHPRVPAVRNGREPSIKARSQRGDLGRQRIGEIAVLAPAKSVPRHGDGRAKPGVIVVPSDQRGAIFGSQQPREHRPAFRVERGFDGSPVDHGQGVGHGRALAKRTPPCLPALAVEPVSGDSPPRSQPPPASTAGVRAPGAGCRRSSPRPNRPCHRARSGCRYR